MNFPKTFPDGKIIDCRDFSNGYVLEMQIVNHCNLNCYGCNHFSPIADFWYIDEEEFENQIKLLFQKLPELKRFILIGGEPFLHPNLVKLIEIFKKYFSDIEIDIITNGLLLNSISNEDIIKYNNNKINISVSLYQNFLSENDCEQLKDKFNSIEFLNRPIFSQFVIDKTGQQKTFFQREICNLAVIPCFTLFNYKIYICPFSAYSSFCEKGLLSEMDYLDLNDNLTFKDLISFCYSEKQICKYCKEDFPHLWIRSNGERNEYLLDKKSLYLYDYNRYNEIYNNINLYHKNFLSSFGIYEPYASSYQKYLDTRFNYCLIDIIIPFYHISIEQLKMLKNNLMNQSIIDNCCIYFISDNSPNEEIVWDIFDDKKLNVAFLKTPYRQGPGMARQLGIDNSYGKYFFFLDIDDLLIDYTGLEKLYQVAEKNQSDITCGNTILYNIEQNTFDSNVNTGHGYLYNRNFIIKNEIKNIESFYGEDEYWLLLIKYYNPRITRINSKIYLYIYNINNLHRQETSPIEKKKIKILLTTLFLITHNNYYDKKNDIQHLISFLENPTVLLENDFKQNIIKILNQSPSVDLNFISKECNQLSKICPKIKEKMIDAINFQRIK